MNYFLVNRALGVQSLVVALWLLAPTSVLVAQDANAKLNANITVHFTPRRPANRFSPAHALGAAVDGHDKGSTDLLLTPSIIQQMLTAGLKPLTYRLRTELAGDAWHWNPTGTWSQSAWKQGYWTSSPNLGSSISVSYGYRLPRRGNTIDQANDDSYSRLDDDDTDRFWKSNPYLDRVFTGESNTIHPQWIVIEFTRPEEINALRILWGRLFAVSYRIQYANINDVSDIALNPPGMWQDFPMSVFVGGADYPPKSKGHLLRVSNNPIKVRWIRILMTESSGASETPSNDIRDRVGFAVREIYAGYQDAKGKFHDRMHHAANRKRQTIIHVSSTDPWHRDSDIDEGVEEPGFDRIFASGLTNDLPVLLPTGLLYDTPDNAANEIRYLRARGYKFDRVELGEEPDGQYCAPEDFGALFVQWAEAIHRVDPNLKVGGPSLQEILPDDDHRLSKLGNSEWMRRFLDYLKRRGHSKDFAFFSFEWYPFDDVCAPVAPQLARAPKMLEASLRDMERRGLSRQIPWIISEYGYSALATRAELDIEGALLNADIVGKFLTLGGDQAFLLGYTPGYIDRDSACTAGNNMLFSVGDDGGIKDRFATYFGAQLITQQWLRPGDEIHEIYEASSDIRDDTGNQFITAYAVHRPDGLWSLLLINKDPNRIFQAGLIFRNESSNSHGRFEGKIDLYQYSSKQFMLGGPLNNPRPIRADNPQHETFETSGATPQPVSLPPYSLTVVRGNVKFN